MVSVEKFIEKLLLKHDCVIMPGLGGFVTHYEPPYRDEESGLFYPPTRTIGFNARLKINDGLLVQAYMQAFDTNYPEANRMVEREIERVKELLHSQGAFDFLCFRPLCCSRQGYTTYRNGRSRTYEP